MYECNDVIYKNVLNINHLSIKKHNITCIVGQSGSGKTTLLRLLNKMISCDSGSILFEGEPIEHIDSIKLRRKVVMLPQSPAIFKGSIRDNLLIGRKFAELPSVPDETLIETLMLTHLNKDLKENADDLSGGEKQRIALGRVILMEPEVLLLDEPSSALDEFTEHLIIKAVVDYTKNHNKTLIMVTHSKKVAEDFADDKIEIEQGRIVNRG